MVSTKMERLTWTVFPVQRRLALSSSLTAHDTNVDSQCPIPAGGSFTYTFTLGQYGTYWYHSHTAVEYTDGLLGVNL